MFKPNNPRLHTATPSPSCDQSQSALFTKLPLDIRRHIYLQLWLDCGLAQHIFDFGNTSYLQSYPCIIDDNEWDKDPKPPIEESSTEAPDLDPPSPTPDGQAPAAQETQPQPYEDPGDIDSAIQDIDPGPEDDKSHSPWCHHAPCHDLFIQKWGRSYPRAYSAAYRKTPSFGNAIQQEGAEARLRASPMLLSLLVCKRMYQEAGESLYSRLRFSFSPETLERFVTNVPRSLTGRIQFVDVVTGSQSYYRTLITLEKRVQTLCKMLDDAFPNLRELRLTLHPTRPRAPMPPAKAFAPFYDFAEGMQNLRKFDIALSFHCEKDSQIGYGWTPDFLRDAPFKVVLVPQGWHENGQCDAWISP